MLEEGGVWVCGSGPVMSRQTLMDELLSDVWHFFLCESEVHTFVCVTLGVMESHILLL